MKLRIRKTGGGVWLIPEQKTVLDLSEIFSTNIVKFDKPIVTFKESLLQEVCLNLLNLTLPLFEDCHISTGKFNKVEEKSTNSLQSVKIVSEEYFVF